VQSDTSSTLVFGSMSALAPTTTVAVPFDPSMDVARFAALMPATTSGGIGWRINASPGNGYAIGPVLQSGTAAATDTMIPIAYANPFATSDNWDPVFVVSDTASRTFTPTAPALPVTLYSQLVQFTAADATASVSFPASMPQTIAVAGTPLITDGLAITLDPTQPVTVTVTPDLTTTTLYELELYALVPDTGNTALMYQEVFSATSDQPTLTLPPELFQDGTYTMRAVCIDGSYPNAEAGDVTTHPFPFGYGFLDSGVFTVSH
jgi:hypothetical protein